MTNLPQIKVDIDGSSIVSNAQQMLINVKEIAEFERKRELKTDQDFSDREGFIKTIKSTRKNLKDESDRIEKNFEDLAKFKASKDEIDSILQKLQSDFEKQIKEEKERKKAEKVTEAQRQWEELILKLNKETAPTMVSNHPNFISPDFRTAIKGKKTLDSIEKAISAEFERCNKIACDILSLVNQNIEIYKEKVTVEHQQLFNDLPQIGLYQTEQFSMILDQRIDQHKENEKRRLEVERKRIEAENERKLEEERKRIQIEEQQKAEAKLKAESEEQKQNLTEPIINKTSDPSYTGIGQNIQETKPNPDVQHVEQKQLSDVDQDREVLKRFRVQLNEIFPKSGNLNTNEARHAVQVLKNSLKSGINEIILFIDKA